ncbi:MAG: ECF transporter S component [Eubacterium sp.]|nr:ECF transporter S component [Eubacterium sp.]
MKLNTKQIVITVLLLILSFLIIRFLKVPNLEVAGYRISTSDILINLILILGTFYCGIFSGVILSIMAPIISFVVSGGGFIASIPAILPCIMAGNLILVLAAWLIRGKKNEAGLFPLVLVLGATLKFITMRLLVLNWIIPTWKSSLSHLQINTVKNMFMLAPLFTTLFGVFLACVLWPPIKLFFKASK